MNIETLKQSNKKKYIIGSIIVIAILATITYISTRAKYRITSTTQLASGTINYSPSDLELVAIKIQNDSNEYDNTDTVPTSGYELNTTLSICEVGGTKQDVTITYENGKVGISGITSKGTKCEIYFDKEKLKGKDLILSHNTIDTSRSSGKFTSGYTANTAGKIFSGTDDDGTTYFFAGSEPNNWVSFAGYYWRIIRINGEGSVRIIYNGPTTAQTGSTTQIGTSKFSHKDAVYNEAYSKDNAYVGYMYGTAGSSTYKDTHANTNSSEVKNVLDTWYQENLKINYEQYIDVNVGFCGDRSLTSGDGIGETITFYEPSNRSNKTYKCSNNNDYYTVNISNKGNKALTYPIGLITSDELMYAGGYINGTQYHWLRTGQTYWTISPDIYNGSSSCLSTVYTAGNRAQSHVALQNGIRPVINLKADTLTLGSGTTSDPYRIA